MNPAPLLGRGDALDSMASGFVPKRLDTLALETDGCKAGGRFLDPGLSTLPVSEAQVGAGQVRDEELGVVPALGGADFETAIYLFLR